MRNHFILMAMGLLLMGLITACDFTDDNVATTQLSAAVTPINSIENSALGLEHSMVVYKDAQCGCCGLWVDHMQQAGFQLAVENTTKLAAIKQQLGISPQYQSCHTLFDHDSGFVFEGHIPANIVERFLNEKPVDAIGLAVPGMPVGSPGMEVNNQFMPYQVYLLKADGSSDIYATVSTQQEQY